MKKVLTAMTASGLAAGTALAGVTTTLDLASAYVFRGVTLNDGAVLQPGIEASGFDMPEEWGAVAIGAWGNYDLDDYKPNGVSGSEFQETDWYGSYSLPELVEGLDLYIGYTEYTYTYGTNSRDKEMNFGAGYEISGVYLDLAWYQGVGGGIGTQAYIELLAGYALDVSDELSASIDASIAYLDPDDSSAADSGFHNYSIGGSVSYALTDAWSAGASVAYIGQGDDDVLGDSTAGSAGYDVEFVGMIGVACEM